MSAPIALIFAAGPRIGTSVAKELAADGYKIALTSRTAPKDASSSHLHIQSDLSEPKSVVDVFAQVRQSLGEPSVVVYNAGAVTPNAPTDPFEVNLDTFQRDFNINATSAFVAIKEALASFNALPTSASRTFIYTGNAMNLGLFPHVLTLTVGKTGAAQLINFAAAAYASKGFKFYFADERSPEGKLRGRTISGEAHAELYRKLVKDETQGPWLQTFVKDKGYVNFPKDTDVTL